MTLRVRIPAILILSLLLLATCIIGISFGKYEELNINKHVKMAEGITTLMAGRFDVNQVDYYIEENYSSREYMDLLKYYYTMKESYPDVKYMYVYKVFKDESEEQGKGLVIIDLDEEYTEDVPIDSIEWIGEITSLDPEFAEDLDLMTKEKECVWHIVNADDGDGKIIAYTRPILDADGNYVCSACVDFSLNELYAKGVDFIIELLIVIVTIIVAVIMIINVILNVILFKPLDKMTKCIESFKFDSDEDRFNNVNAIEALNINVKNEIDELYNALVMSMKDSAYYMSNFNRAKTEIEEISETAYKDALTGVGSKTAYGIAMQKLQDELNRDKNISFAIVMVDINNLKYVNDTYGHEIGDDYIMGCCHIMCSIFKRSPVFRIGGDEFVIILKGDDYAVRNFFTDDLEFEYERTYSDKSLKEYRRYSASVGMAEYDPAVDTSVEDVFKRADSLMYEYKKEFKKKHGSYR